MGLDFLEKIFNYRRLPGYNKGILVCACGVCAGFLIQIFLIDSSI